MSLWLTPATRYPGLDVRSNSRNASLRSNWTLLPTSLHRVLDGELDVAVSAAGLQIEEPVRGHRAGKVRIIRRGRILVSVDRVILLTALVYRSLEDRNGHFFLPVCSEFIYLVKSNCGSRPRQ